MSRSLKLRIHRDSTLTFLASLSIPFTWHPAWTDLLSYRYIDPQALRPLTVWLLCNAVSRIVDSHVFKVLNILIQNAYWHGYRFTEASAQSKIVHIAMINDEPFTRKLQTPDSRLLSQPHLLILTPSQYTTSQRPTTTPVYLWDSSIYPTTRRIWSNPCWHGK